MWIKSLYASNVLTRLLLECCLESDLSRLFSLRELEWLDMIVLDYVRKASIASGMLTIIIEETNPPLIHFAHKAVIYGS